MLMRVTCFFIVLTLFPGFSGNVQASENAVYTYLRDYLLAYHRVHAPIRKIQQEPSGRLYGSEKAHILDSVRLQKEASELMLPAIKFLTDKYADSDNYLIRTHVLTTEKTVLQLSSTLKTTAGIMTRIVETANGIDPEAHKKSIHALNTIGPKLTGILNDLKQMGPMMTLVVMAPEPKADSNGVMSFNFLDTKNNYLNLTAAQRDELVMLIRKFYGEYDELRNMQHGKASIAQIVILNGVLSRRGFRASDEEKEGKIYATLQDQVNDNLPE